MTRNIKEWWNIGNVGRVRCSILIILFILWLADNVSAKELWNTVGPAPDSSEASANVLSAIKDGYTAFQVSETEGVEARRINLRDAGFEMIEASNQMNVILAGMEERGIDVVLDYGAIGEQGIAIVDSWAVSIDGGFQPKTTTELYALVVNSTEQLGQKFIEWSERTDDEVFLDFVRETSAYLQAGAFGSRLFEASFQ